AIRVGLRGIRQMGPVNLGRILEERARGPFVDTVDFRRRTGVNENLLTSLILAGAFDSLGLSRKQCLMNLKNQSRLKEYREPDSEDYSTKEKVGFELEYLGLDLTAHIISLYRKGLDQIGVLRSEELRKRGDGEKVVVAGMKILLHTPPTRSGVRVVFATLEDETGVTDVTVFPVTQEQDAPVLFTSDLLVVEGTTHRRGTSISINAERIFDLKDALSHHITGKRISVA
ncbi:MAG: OB-fold nucleic acid binding domain-containing protein, partial [bacterium]|nr:OB-fold nucleic acid binding domain-containing protein [bacterium]